ncbi:MAG: hypothetical protein PHQ64_00945 [Bacilli bacterium]|nr:hypothetical protein [Bacilli bacterium]
MKLYHIDRSGHIKEGQVVELTKNFYTSTTNNEYFKDGLSSHGLTFFLADQLNKNFAIDAIFEYERMLNYSNKLSRYQALFAFDEKGLVNFIKEKQLEDNYYKIYEIDVDDYEAHDFNLVKGWSHCTMSNFAKLYWESNNLSDNNNEVIYEYLVRLPITIGKEVTLEEIKKENNE